MYEDLIMQGYALMKTAKLEIYEVKGLGEIKIIPEAGNVLFCAKDIAKISGYKKPIKAIETNCKDITKRLIYTKYGIREIDFIHHDEVRKLINRGPFSQEQKDKLTQEIDDLFEFWYRQAWFNSL